MTPSNTRLSQPVPIWLCSKFARRRGPLKKTRNQSFFVKKDAIIWTSNRHSSRFTPAHHHAFHNGLAAIIKLCHKELLSTPFTNLQFRLLTSIFQLAKAIGETMSAQMRQ